MPSSVYLEEKSDEQKKEEVSCQSPLLMVEEGEGEEGSPLTPALCSCSVPWWPSWGTETAPFRRTPSRAWMRRSG